ncbi:MFS transporter [Jiella pelagia]|uniref:MFS transporter n=1 Tax=Jiella pelagia TaxID=2986949 RepID=A0ABY7C1T8_9HYPH|nr:MFS transporter [Jiella pelagia]WAP69716.1 MFS transporter [Jiella pelagia]
MTGFIATAITFGPGRMAYGMFLPQLREEFGFGTSTVGAIAGAAFAAFFVALFLTGWLTPRFGPRLPVLIGGCLATAGFALTAYAPGLVTMSIGVALASASAGFAWTPFNSMAEQAVEGHHQKRVLSIVSTGTTFGIIAAGLLALGMALWGQSWRIAWWAFAAIALGVVAAPRLLLSRRDGFERGGRLDIRNIFARLRCREAVPLYGLALSFGATNGTYLSYWIDHISQSGGLTGVPAELIGPVLFVAFGLAGCLGLLTGDVVERIGLKALLFALFAGSAASLLLLAFMPGSWAGTIVSAALQGICLMALSAIYSFWSERLFPDISSASFTAVLLLYALGNVAAPPLAGLLSGGLGLGMTLALFGGLSLASLLLVRRVRDIHE